MLVERQRIGWGASGRNGGFVGPGFALRSGALIEQLGEDHARQLYAQSQRGVEIVRASLKEMGRPDILMGWGRLSVSRTDQGPDFAERSRALAEKLGATFEPWETDRVRALLVTPRYFQGLHDAQGFQIHPLNLALALAADAERRGVQVHEATEARALERRGTEWQLRTAMGEITARHVVLAGNADLGRMHRLGARRPAGGDLCRGDRQARPAARRGHPLARRDRRHAPRRRLLPHRRRATACCGAAASPPTRASRRGCAP